MSRPTTQQTPPDWTRPRLLTTVVGAAAAVMLLLGSGVWAVCLAFAGAHGTSTISSGQLTVASSKESSAQVLGAAHRDVIAARPMLAVPEAAAFPSQSEEKTDTKLRRIAVPGGTAVNGPAFVLTGFPPTPAGAIGQLAQIDAAVLPTMNRDTAEEVYDAWALPGGVRAEGWWVTRSVEAFLSSAGMGQVKDLNASVTLKPVAAQVKGTDGPQWAVPCVLFEVTATFRSEARIAFAHCERMQWVGGRWMIAPGTPPAPAPATWPGTGLATQAGWRTWTEADDLAIED